MVFQCPLLMTIFTLLTLVNIKKHRNQIENNNNNNLIFQRRKKEEFLIVRMILIKLILNIILSLSITIYLFYNGLTQYQLKFLLKIIFIIS